MAYAFDGTNESLHWGDIPAIDDATVLSCSAWMWNDDLTSGDHNIIGQYSGGAGMIFQMDDVGSLYGNTDCFVIFIQESLGGIARIEGATNSAVAGQWQHVFFSFVADTAGTGLQLWIDGAEDSDSPKSTTGVLDVGKTGNNIEAAELGGARDHKGKLAEIAYWTRALSDGEIVALSKGYAPSFFLDSGVFYAPLLRHTDDVWGGIAATVGGTPTVAEHPRMIYPSHPQVVAAPAAAAGGGLAWKLAASRPALAGVGGLAG